MGRAERLRARRDDAGRRRVDRAPAGPRLVGPVVNDEGARRARGLAEQGGELVADLVASLLVPRARRVANDEADERSHAAIVGGVVEHDAQWRTARDDLTRKALRTP